MSAIVRTAVFPVAGRGTRFLPATKASPKEMLPIVDKPLIQYAVEEAIAAGVEKLVFVTGSSKRSIEDHFDSDAELERALEEAGKDELLQTVRDIVPSNVSCIYIRQGQPLGLGHAVLCSRPAVGAEPFFVHLADDLIHGATPCLQQMADVHREHGGSCLAVQRVPRSQTGSYGIVDVQDASDGAPQRISHMVEKPAPEDAPSDMAVVGVIFWIRQSSTSCKPPNAVPAVRSSSLTGSPPCSTNDRCTHTSSRVRATTAARNSATCRPPSNSPWNTRNSAHDSAPT